MNSKNLHPILKKIAIGLMALQIVLGCVWCIANFTTFPPYGDTPEYILISYTLRLDVWRPIAFPLFIRLCIDIARAIGHGVRYYSVAYVFAITLGYGSVYYFLNHLTQNYMGGKQPRGKLAFVTAFILMNPLMIHFNMSIMTDGLCTSFSLIFVTEVIRIINRDGRRLRAVPVGIVAFIMMSLLRAERLMVMSMLLIMLAVVLTIVMKRPDKKQIIVAILAIMVVAVPATNCIKQLTQTTDIGRVNPSIHTALSQRICWPFLAQSYDTLPDNLKKIITKEDAEYHDASRLNTNTIATKIEKADPENYNKNLDAMTLSVLTHSTGDVVGYIGTEYLWNVFCPVIENVQSFYKANSINLTWERISRETPNIALVYTIVTEITFWYLLILLLIMLCSDPTPFVMAKNLLVMLAVYVLFQSAVYTMTSNYGFHIRYQMLNYILQIITMTAIFYFGPSKKPTSLE